MSNGNLIWVRCYYGLTPFKHYGIDCGDGSVIHLAGTDDELDRKSMKVRRVSMAEFAKERPVQVEDIDSVLSPDEVVANAQRFIGDERYDLIHWNCEHLARQCKTGHASSRQVDEIEGVTKTGLQAAAKIALTGLSKTTLAKTLLGTAFRVGKISPAMFASDVVECTANWYATRAGYKSAETERYVDLLGRSTAAVVGFVQAGPIGSSAMVALHVASKSASKAITDRIKQRGEQQHSAGQQHKGE